MKMSEGVGKASLCLALTVADWTLGHGHYLLGEKTSGKKYSIILLSGDGLTTHHG